jgi:MFS transporter, PAT family, beta-lactamase induction signal transducer AmpG
MKPDADPVIAPQSLAAHVAALAERRSLTMLALGFSAGLPAALIFDTLSLWLRTRDVSLETIGFLSLVTLVYSFKFLWAPVLDRVALPLLTARLGRRRSWMFASQVLVALGLGLMATIDPAARLQTTAALALFVGIASATQDIAIDAWRIEVSSASRLGVMAATYQWGYRIAILAAGALPLILAEPFGWNVSYAVMAALMTLGMAAALVAPTEEALPSYSTAVSTKPRLFGHLAAAFVQPIREFFRHHGSGAVLALMLVCTYRLPDLVRSIMGPFYLDLGFTLVEIAEASRGWGMVMTMVGVGAGGVAVARFGLRCALVAGALCGPAAGLALAWLTTQGPDVRALVVATGIANAMGGFAGTCLIAYMSSLTSGGFTATQYALLSSLFTLPGRLLASQSGRIVEGAAHAAQRDSGLAPLMPLFSGLPAPAPLLRAGYLVFFLYSALLGAPAVLLAISWARRQPNSSNEFGRGGTGFT